MPRLVSLNITVQVDVNHGVVVRQSVSNCLAGVGWFHTRCPKTWTRSMTDRPEALSLSREKRSSIRLFEFGDYNSFSLCQCLVNSWLHLHSTIFAQYIDSMEHKLSRIPACQPHSVMLLLWLTLHSTNNQWNKAWQNTRLHKCLFNSQCLY